MSDEPKEKKEITSVIHQEIGQVEMSQGKYGPNILKAQVVHYGGRAEKPGLNLQHFYTDKDGELKFGKRPLLTLPLLRWIQENHVIESAIATLSKLDIEFKAKAAEVQK